MNNEWKASNESQGNLATPNEVILHAWPSVSESESESQWESASPESAISFFVERRKTLQRPPGNPS